MDGYDEGRILQILPSWPWTLLLYKWEPPNADISQLNLIKFITMDWVQTSVIGMYRLQNTLKYISILLVPHLYGRGTLVVPETLPS